MRFSSRSILWIVAPQVVEALVPAYALYSLLQDFECLGGVVAIAEYGDVPGVRHEAGFGLLDYGDERLLERPAEEAVNLNTVRG